MFRNAVVVVLGWVADDFGALLCVPKPNTFGTPSPGTADTGERVVTTVRQTGHHVSGNIVRRARDLDALTALSYLMERESTSQDLVCVLPELRQAVCRLRASERGLVVHALEGGQVLCARHKGRLK